MLWSGLVITEFIRAPQEHSPAFHQFTGSIYPRMQLESRARGTSPVKQPDAAEELRSAEDFAYRARLMDEHGCAELSCLYERASIATALKAQILSEIEKKISQEVVPVQA